MMELLGRLTDWALRQDREIVRLQNRVGFLEEVVKAFQDRLTKLEDQDFLDDYKDERLAK